MQCYRLFAIQPIPEAASRQQNKKKNADKTTDSRRRNRNKEEERERERTKSEAQKRHAGKSKSEKTKRSSNSKESQAGQSSTAQPAAGERDGGAQRKWANFDDKELKAIDNRDSVLSGVSMGLCSAQQTKPPLCGV